VIERLMLLQRTFVALGRELRHGLLCDSGRLGQLLTKGRGSVLDAGQLAAVSRWMTLIALAYIK
jgi:hypothetical protein